MKYYIIAYNYLRSDGNPVYCTNTIQAGSKRSLVEVLLMISRARMLKSIIPIFFEEISEIDYVSFNEYFPGQ